MKLIVGLGNPGKKYTFTRHNVGWMVLDTLTGKSQWKESVKAQAFIYKTEIGGKEVELLKPNTFMNNSGVAVAYALKKHPTAELIVVHDDKDIPLGEIRVQTDRGAAGHNGVKSIMEHLGTQNFTRVRVGIAPSKPLNMDAADFVLEKFAKEEKKKLNEAIVEAGRRIRELI